MKSLEEEFEDLKQWEIKAVEQNFKDIEECIRQANNHFNILKAFLKACGKNTKVYVRDERRKDLEKICNGEE